VSIRSRAETDLHEAYQWYEAQRPGLGIDFLDELKRAMTLLEGKPERRPCYYRGFRRLLTSRFPYKIFYRVETDQVIVFRVLHAKRLFHAPPCLFKRTLMR
jgi:plasmid stabilization system protein ParE